MPKQTLRRQIKQQRQALSQQQQHTAEHSLTTLLLQQPAINTSQHIALYLPHKGEISLQAFAKKAWEAGKNLYLPVINPTHSSNPEAPSMRFKLWEASTPLIKNNFGIAEPNTEQCINPEQLDLVLMPLVAFDKKGNRLGMGGGFYDKTFAFKKTNPQQKPLLVGIAHAFQEVDALSTNSWDVTMNGIATDKNIFWF